MSNNTDVTANPSIFANGKAYSVKDLSQEARAQFASLQFAESEVKRLEAQVAVAKTAASAYRSALLAQLQK